MGVLKLFIFLLTIAAAKSSLDILQELFESEPTCTKCLSHHAVGNITEEIKHKFGCANTTCGCLTETEIYRLTGANQQKGICENEFPKFMLVLFQYAQDVNSTCGNGTQLAYSDYVAMATSLFSHSEPLEHMVAEVFHTIMKNIPEDHEDHEEDNDSHKDHGHEDHDEDHEEDHDSHEDHDHEDEHEESHEDHDHEGDHDEEGHEDHDHHEDHEDGDEDHDNHEDQNHEDHENEGHDSHEGHGHDNHDEDHEEDDHEDHDGHGHEDHEGHDSHEEHDSHEDREDHNIKCFSVDQILDVVGMHLESDGELEMFATEVMTYILRGFRYSEKCKALPKQEEFSKALFAQLGIENELHMGKKDLAKLMTKLKIGGSSSSHMEEEEEGHEGHDHAEHARKKRQAQGNSINTCYNADALLAIYNVDGEFTSDKFSQICPALIQQQISDACASPVMTTPTKKTVSDAEKYGYGLIAVIIISLCSLVGLLMVPCQGKSKDIILAILIGLAVGSLVADAVLHLIPAALGIHAHGSEIHAHDHGGIVLEDYVQTGLGILAAIYGFFALESVMGMFSARAGRNNVAHGHSHSHVMEEKNIGSISKQDLTSPNGSPAGSQVIAGERGVCGIKSVAWMIVIGDGIHNFADGLAIGAAFSFGFRDGLATSVAVLCHELPHEFGDFAVLINSGMSYKMAALLNLLSALTAVIGMFIGAAITTSPLVSKWIFTVVAGMFIYVALADMIPELVAMQRAVKSACQWLNTFLLETFGFLLGVFILTLIAVFEEKITF